MEDLIGLIIFGGFALLSLAARAMKQRGEQQGQGPNAPRPAQRPQWPGPVAGGPSWPQPGPSRSPGQPAPRSTGQTDEDRQARSKQRPRPDGRLVRPGEGQAPGQPVGWQGAQALRPLSVEELTSEGESAMVTGTLREDRSRFAAQSEQFRRGGHRHQEAAVIEQPEVSNPVLAVLATKEGLAQAVLAAEILGKPRALRPFTKR